MVRRRREPAGARHVRRVRQGAVPSQQRRRGDLQQRGRAATRCLQRSPRRRLSAGVKPASFSTTCSAAPVSPDRRVQCCSRDSHQHAHARRRRLPTLGTDEPSRQRQPPRIGCGCHLSSRVEPRPCRGNRPDGPIPCPRRRSHPARGSKTRPGGIDTVCASERIHVRAAA